ncbi:MAG: GerMN domain-containing protein [Candidatus Onthomonas sp.]|nr:GerMN domain-containing protein [Candidatus Onthomonas sp.]
MMRQSLSLLLVVMTALSLSACGQQDSGDSNATVNRTYKLSDATSSGSSSPDGTQSDAPPSRTCPLLYYPDSTGTYIVSRELSNLSLSDQTLDVKLVDALIDGGILNQDVTLNSLSFDLTEDRTQEVLLLDFTKPFQKQISSCGPEQERLLIGSVVDTFLSAYGRELAQITVEGKKLVSKNEFSYADPVPWYDGCDTEPFNETVKIDGVRLKLSLERVYSDAGFLISQDTEQFAYRYDSSTRTAIFQAPDTRHRDETPASLSITPTALTQEATLTRARQILSGGKIEESTVKVGENQVEATCLTVTDDKGGTACYIFTDDDRVWLAQLAWNAGEEETRLARMHYMLSTFLAVS